jgi:hypothetical protein
MRRAGTFIPIATQSLPVELVTVELSVIVLAAVVTVTVSLPLDRLASTMAGSGFGPISYFSTSCLISLRRHRQSALALMRLPSCIANGSGSLRCSFVGAAPAAQSAPAFSTSAPPSADAPAAAVMPAPPPAPALAPADDTLSPPAPASAIRVTEGLPALPCLPPVEPAICAAAPPCPVSWCAPATAMRPASLFACPAAPLGPPTSVARTDSLASDVGLLQATANT